MSIDDVIRNASQQAAKRIVGSFDEYILTQLKFRFPWLGTDEEASGAEAVDTLNEWYDVLVAKQRELETSQ